MFSRVESIVSQVVSAKFLVYLVTLSTVVLYLVTLSIIVLRKVFQTFGQRVIDPLSLSAVHLLVDKYQAR